VTQPLPNVTDVDWDKRYDLTLRQEGELKLFGNTSILEQGILFDKTTPVDEWRYPEDGKRVRGGLAGERTDPQARNSHEARHHHLSHQRTVIEGRTSMQVV